MKPDAVERAEAKAQRLIDRAVDAQLDNDKWPTRARRVLTDEQKAQVRRLSHERAAAGKEKAELEEIPFKQVNEEKPPEKGKLFDLAMSDEVRYKLAPMRRRLVILLAAYADGGNTSPPMRSLAARTHTTVPNVMYLLRWLEQYRWVEIEWATEPHMSNTYKLNLRDSDGD